MLRPAKKHKFRLQYTPMSYESSTTFQRNIVFNGILYPVALPVASEFDWNVLRFGYEYDFVYTSRGYVGVIIEGRYTKFNAELKSPIAAEFASARAPLPALGFAARGYVVKNVALNLDWTFFNLDTFHLPRLADQGHDRHVSRRRHQRDDQLQRVLRRGGRLAADDDAARHRPRPRQPEVPGDVVRSSRSVLTLEYGTSSALEVRTSRALRSGLQGTRGPDFKSA